MNTPEIDFETAVQIFDELFFREAKVENPSLPEYFVTRPVFYNALKQVGCKPYKNPEQFFDWMSRIGLTRHVQKRITNYKQQLMRELRKAEREYLLKTKEIK